MIALERIRRQGFTLKPVPDGLYIDPIDELTEVQRQWLIGNKPEIRQQLLLERWQWFLKLAMKHGINPDVVAAEFPSESDQLDVIEPAEHTDELLRRCMATQCKDLRVRQRQANYEAGRWVPLAEAMLLKEIDKTG
jgi:hypothetical protein